MVLSYWSLREKELHERDDIVGEVENSCVEFTLIVFVRDVM